MTVIEHSPILRTVFVEVESPDFDFAYAQLVVKSWAPTIHEVAVHSLDEMSAWSRDNPEVRQNPHGPKRPFRTVQELQDELHKGSRAARWIS